MTAAQASLCRRIVSGLFFGAAIGRSHGFEQPWPARNQGGPDRDGASIQKIPTLNCLIHRQGPIPFVAHVSLRVSTGGLENNLQGQLQDSRVVRSTDLTECSRQYRAVGR